MKKTVFIAAGLATLSGILWAQTAGEASMTKGKELAQPKLRLQLQGETGRRLDAIVKNWLLPAPQANPGMIEMMRLRDRQPPYEDPVPWAGEFIGKYLTSAILARRASSSVDLDHLLQKLIPEFIATQAEDGYLGPFPKNERLLGHWDLWGHYHALLALYTWYCDTGDRQALEAALRAADLVCATYLDTERRVYDAGSGEMNMAIMHVLGMLYRETGREPYYRMMQEIMKDWERPPSGDYYRQAFTGVEFYETPKPRWESLHPMQSLAEFYRITGDESYKQALLHWWYSIARTDVHNSGSFSTNEQAVGNPFQPGSIETCCTVAWIAYSIDALRLAADSIIADALELATWNAVLGYEHPSGRWCTYDTPMNGKRLASAHSIVFQSRPGTPELNCCSVNGPRGLGMISDWALLGSAAGLYVNYYGPGTMTARLDDGSDWTIVQKTNYPADGKIDFALRIAKPTPMPLMLRIPAWSENTALYVNREAVEGVKPGTYFTLDREWRSNDQIQLILDMRPRALRGDENVQFNASLYAGPLLLAFDQKQNALDPGQVPAIDFKNLELVPAATDAQFQPIVLYRVAAADGQEIFLTDFATAGASGAAYRSWLPVRNAPPAPFRLVYPENRARLPVEPVFLQWSGAGPGATYDLCIATDPELSQVIAAKAGLRGNSVLLDDALPVDTPCYWQVTAHVEGQTAASAGEPRSFILDPAVETSMQGVVLDAPLAGNANPVEGKLLQEVDLAPAADRKGAENGALSFNGTTSKLIYDAPRFPLRTYTFAAWFCPRNLGADDTTWHHIFSAWCKGMDDPLRVSVVKKELAVNIEQGSGTWRAPGVPVENGVWTHVVVVKDYGELRVYVNGRRTSSVVVPMALQSGAKSIGIGCNPNYTDLEGFSGEIAEVRFLRAAIEDNAVPALYRP